MRILICEDDPSRSEALSASVGIACPGAEVQRAVPGTSVVRAVAEAAPALTVVGPGLADGDGGGELVRVLCAEHPELAVLVVSTRDLAAPAVAALRAGAADYVVVLADGDDLAALGRAAARLVCRDGHRPPRPAGRAAPAALAGLVGRSPAMQQVRELVRTAARAEAHVLIEGETGTGKEVGWRAPCTPSAAAPQVPSCRETGQYRTDSLPARRPPVNRGSWCGFTSCSAEALSLPGNPCGALASCRRLSP